MASFPCILNILIYFLYKKLLKKLILLHKTYKNLKMDFCSYFHILKTLNCIYLYIFLGFSHSKFSELSNENLLFLVLAFCLGLISAYLTKIKFFKGEKYV